MYNSSKWVDLFDVFNIAMFCLLYNSFDYIYINRKSMVKIIGFQFIHMKASKIERCVQQKHQKWYWLVSNCDNDSNQWVFSKRMFTAQWVFGGVRRIVLSIWKSVQTNKIQADLLFDPDWKSAYCSMPKPMQITTWMCLIMWILKREKRTKQ